MGYVKNGYYLSAYCDIDPLGNILSTSIRHDHNISLWKVKDNVVSLEYHCEFERISGIKHHNIPFYCKEDFDIFLNDLLKEFHLERKDIVDIIGINKKDSETNLPLSYHSLCHLFTSIGIDSNIFYNHKILGLALDSEPDNIIDKNAKNKYFYAGAYINQGKKEFFAVSSPGVLWTTAVEKLKMPEGTLMALAYASQSLSYIDYDYPYPIMDKNNILYAQLYISKICDEIMSFTSDDQGKKFNFFDPRFTLYENKVSMIMKIIQKMSMKIVDKCIDEILELYKIDPKETYIALSGGYSLNCPTNTHLMQKYAFKGQLAMPCVNDSGQAIGIGLFYFYRNIPNMIFRYQNAYLGNNSVYYDSSFDYYIARKNKGLHSFIEDIQEGPIIWFNGRSEIGPRALGNRSILADPRNIKSKIVLNRIKKREWWRPVAPVILDSMLNEWFDNSFSSPHMLNNFSIKRSKKSQVPSILHLDDTCRVQTVGDENKLLEQALQLFYTHTGIPILCNTSLNDKNEPIIETINEALNFALRKGIKVAYINGVRFQLTHHNEYKNQEKLERNHNIFLKYQKNNKLIETLNPFKITAKEYDIYKNGGILTDFNFTSKSDVKKFKKIINKSLYIYKNKYLT